MGRIPYEVTGVSTPLFGIQWQKTSTDRRIAREVIVFLEDRRLLFGDRHVEDEGHCVRSALQIRAFLTEQLKRHEMGRELSTALKAMRAACRQFVDVAGPQGENFGYRMGPIGANRFGLALGDLRSQMGFYVAAIATQYKIEVDDDLATILPPPPEDEDEDVSWFPGFGGE
ncbi:DUF6650 family protein [[Actinomadura] parvosata]|uniref:DUF6650 family protein n=1 Tax=[Actinomadura] parvosata TaxID=1955412 RepID=UPI0012BBC225|nr:DUF6650 family protein [Nonomuraea sp. ATCC 55076]